MTGKPRKSTSPNASPRKSAKGRDTDQRERFFVTHRDTLIESIDEAIANLRNLVEMLIDDFDREGEGGFGGLDMAVWRNGLLVAVVRRDRGARPKATVFDDAN